MNDLELEQKIEDDPSPYCKDCSHCGFIECCGITSFLKKHVVGKTGCDNEEAVLSDLITLLNLSLTEHMQQGYLRECPKCKTDDCSGWHQVFPATTKDDREAQKAPEARKDDTDHK